MTLTEALSIGSMLGVVVVGVLAKIDAYHAAKVRNDIHTLVNSNMGTQLRSNAILSRRIAMLPGATEEDLNLAFDAEQLWQEHQAKQQTVDDQNKKKDLKI